MKNKGTIKVLGLSVEKFLSTYETDETGEVTDEDTRYNLFVEDLANKNKYVMHLETRSGSCGSGWCPAKYGNIKIEKLEKDVPISHIPLQPTIINDLSINPETLEIDKEIFQHDDEGANNIHNNVFSFSDVGGDIYYPTGYATVNMEAFMPLERAMDARPVWILEGGSGLGKSTLASHLQDLNVFETDSVDILPDKIVADVVVLGNRSGFTADEIAKRLFGYPDVNVIAVNFTQPSKDLPYERNLSEVLSDTSITKSMNRKLIERNKQNILKSRKLRKEIQKRHPEEKISGTVIADKIAEDVISGKEKRTITPEIGAEIRRRKIAEK